MALMTQSCWARACRPFARCCSALLIVSSSPCWHFSSTCPSQPGSTHKRPRMTKEESARVEADRGRPATQGASARPSARWRVGDDTEGPRGRRGGHQPDPLRGRPGSTTWHVRGRRWWSPRGRNAIALKIRELRRRARHPDARGPLLARALYAHCEPNTRCRRRLYRSSRGDGSRSPAQSLMTNGGGCHLKPLPICRFRWTSILAPQNNDGH